VDDSIMLSIIEETIAAQPATFLPVVREPLNGWILDGYPRNPVQAHQLDELLVYREQPLSLVFYLEVPEEILLERIQERWIHPSSGRTYHSTFSPPAVEGRDDITGEPLVKRLDDNENSLRARIRTFHDATMPLLDYYRSKGLLITVPSPNSDVGYITIKKVLSELSGNN